MIRGSSQRRDLRRTPSSSNFPSSLYIFLKTDRTRGSLLLRTLLIPLVLRNLINPRIFRSNIKLSSVLLIEVFTREERSARMNHGKFERKAIILTVFVASCKETSLRKNRKGTKTMETPGERNATIVFVERCRANV